MDEIRQGLCWGAKSLCASSRSDADHSLCARLLLLGLRYVAHDVCVIYVL